MKNFSGMNFGFSAVHAGQRATNFEPQLFAVSTEGNFRITSPVSKILDLSHGEYIMFLSNVDELDRAIREKAEPIVAFCEEYGMEIDSPEAMIAIHKEYDQWAIAKGIKEYDNKGMLKTTSERLSKKDKLKYVTVNFTEMLEMALEQADEQVKDALSRDGITKEEQADILATFVVPKEVPKFKGSKVANPGGVSGSGTVLTFTDSNVWKQLKVDMKDQASEMNRVYDIDIDNIQDVTMSDGYNVVTVKALVIGKYTDKIPARIGGDAEAE